MNSNNIIKKGTINDYNEYMQLAPTINENSPMEDINRLYDLYNLDWTAEEFEEGGLKGLKGLEGEVIVPAMFEQVSSVNYNPDNVGKLPAIAVKNGRCGLVKCDGTGELLVACEHDQIQYFFGTGMFVVTDNGLHGLVALSGETVMPQVAETFYEPCNDFLQYKANGKFGLLNLSTGLFVDALYDEMLVLPEEEIQVTKDGVKGFLSLEDGHFVSAEEAAEEDSGDFLVPFAI